MVAEPVNMNVPLMTGGVGYEQVLRYYKDQFLGQMPADCHVVPVSRTVGADRVVDEHLLCFTHNRVMDAMLPSVPPTGRAVELPVVVIVGNDAGWGLERELQAWATGGAATVACELQSARYDLVMRKRTEDLPAVKAFLDVLQRATLRRKLEALAGYDMSETGTRVT